MYFTGTEATRADNNLFGGTVYYSMHLLQVGLPFFLGTDMGVANAHTRLGGFAANFTFSHENTSFDAGLIKNFFEIKNRTL